MVTGYNLALLLLESGNSLDLAFALNPPRSEKKALVTAEAQLLPGQLTSCTIQHVFENN